MAEIAVEAPQNSCAAAPGPRGGSGRGQDGRHPVAGILEENLFAADKITPPWGNAERALALSTQWGVDVSPTIWKLCGSQI